ncbi:hypothetical protein GWI33_004595 [Rhynchophorus ferrugineus]|uniref:CUB domain-containing protein n=1 Tax=Rhynchophorus ferrugineus TaxID=354439 RepID=A0A834IP72_RHYFE|nr:hypothetical protein GWI33_004595 [Rhynchophorus ferrugineus]
MKAKTADRWCGALLVLGIMRLVDSLPASDVDIWKDEEDERTDTLLEFNATGVGATMDFKRMPRVLNFFPVPFVEECRAKDGRRRGICMNTYECRIEGGKSSGFCALGFGVCCIFTASCNGRIVNNLTYFVNPDYPDLTRGMSSCSLSIKKTNPEISQIRLDFIHFNLGQPNRSTGVCERDVFLMTAPNATKEIKLCGINSGQHVYFDVENLDQNVEITMTLSKKAVTRFWEVIVTQIPFTQRAPPGCLQYHEGDRGLIQTMNFADNGRHLAEQDYTICVRQELNMCSIIYEPCHENAFRIAPNSEIDDIDLDVEPSLEDGEGSGEIDFEEAARALELCNDKIVLPCDSEELIMPEMLGINPGSCSLTHCGSTLCPSGNSPCRIESSVTPFTIGVHFGPSRIESSPEDNLGMCLTYEQLPCVN